MTLSAACILRVMVVAAVPALLQACVEPNRELAYPQGYYGGYYDNTSTERRHDANVQRTDGERIDGAQRDGGYRVCDNDGNRCYVSSTRVWSFPEYQRRQGSRP